MGDGGTFERQLADYLVVKGELEVHRSTLREYVVTELPSLALVSELIAGMRARLMKLALLADCGERRAKLAIELADMDRKIWPFWGPVLQRVVETSPEP
jgi:hypothetical protein